MDLKKKSLYEFIIIFSRLSMDLIKMRFSELESGRKGKELFRELGFITMAASRLNR